MSILVAVLTLIVVLLGLLVAGLLRSHAEILRRLEEIDERPAAAAPGPPSPDAPERPNAATAPEVAGPTLEGEAVKIGFGGGRPDTLLAFLSSGCLGCEAFWRDLRGVGGAALPAGTRLVVVTKGSEMESPSKLREVAGSDVPVVMSTEAWEDYQVAGSPYFLLVDSDGRIAGEGTANTWDQVVSLVSDAIGDARPSEGPHRPSPEGRRGYDGAARLARADAELEAGGIGPEHPSLYSNQVLAEDRPEG